MRETNCIQVNAFNKSIYEPNWIVLFHIILYVFGNSAKIDCPKVYLGRTVYIVVA